MSVGSAEIGTEAVGTASSTGGLFIVGMARGGTDFVGRCLGAHEDVAVFGESLYWGRGYVEPAPDGMYHAEQLAEVRRSLTMRSWGTSFALGGAGRLRNIDRPGLNELIERVLGDDAAPISPADGFRRLRRAICEVEGKRYGIEKTPHHLNWIGRIERAMPGSRFVAMVREPYGWMLSYKHMGDEREGETARSFKRRYHPMSVAIIWRRYIESAMSAPERFPGKVMIVWLDRLKEDSQGELGKVQEFLGLRRMELPVDEAATNTSFARGPRPELAPGDVFWMNLIAGRAIRGAGLPLRRVGFHPISILLPVLRLPYWMVVNFIDLKRSSSGGLGRYLSRWLRADRS